MRNRPLRKKTGFTLIELIIVIALLSVVAMTATLILWFGTGALKASSEEYDFQFSTRLIMQKTTSVVRYASAVFTIPQSSFRADNLDDGWDYIGIQEVLITPAQGGNPAVYGKQIVQYRYDSVTGTHVPYVLLTAKPDVDYEIVFTKVNPNTADSLLQFSIRSYPAGSLDEFGQPRAQFTVTSKVESANSLQVIDLATPLDPAVAIAFRVQERAASVVGHIAMVLDVSGSMADNLAGYTGNPSRISILKTETQSLLSSFALEDNIDVCLVPFATSANNPYPFYNAHANLSSFTSIINGLTAIGGTNTGDGLRRAYWNLKAHSTDVPANTIVKNYVIFLTDGVTTFASVLSDGNRNFVVDNQNVDEGFLDTSPRDSGGQIAGNGSSLDAKGTAYNALMGGKLTENAFAKTYVIGFSSISSELSDLNVVAADCGATSDRIFRADSQTALNQVFTRIREDIVNDLWYLQGPTL